MVPPADLFVGLGEWITYGPTYINLKDTLHLKDICMGNNH